jgi:hypothetical protein
MKKARDRMYKKMNLFDQYLLAQILISRFNENSANESNERCQRGLKRSGLNDSEES